jgi:hypothetical protein
MPSDPSGTHSEFPILISPADKAAMRVEEQRWENEGGRTTATAGYVTRLASADLPYTAVLRRPRGLPLERSFATMREAEAFIRRNTPESRPSLSTLYDRPPEG